MHQGTVKRYLSEFQNNILTLLKKHILTNKTHPIAIMSEIFRNEFYKAYKKYSIPTKNKEGVLNKV